MENLSNTTSIPVIGFSYWCIVVNLFADTLSNASLVYRTQIYSKLSHKNHCVKTPADSVFLLLLYMIFYEDRYTFSGRPSSADGVRAPRHVPYRNSLLTMLLRDSLGRYRLLWSSISCKKISCFFTSRQRKLNLLWILDVIKHLPIRAFDTLSLCSCLWILDTENFNYDKV